MLLNLKDFTTDASGLFQSCSYCYKYEIIKDIPKNAQINQNIRNICYFREGCINPISCTKNFLMPQQISCHVILFTYRFTDVQYMPFFSPTLTTVNSSRVNKMFILEGTLIITFICLLFPNWIIMKCSVIEIALGEARRL